MRAATYERLGPARDVLHLRHVPLPEPRRGEVRVRLAASGVNPSDWKARAGGRGPLAFATIIPHHDGAGVIDAIGPGVDRQIGERVWTWNGQHERPCGTAAEYIVLPEVQAPRLPDGTSFLEGACLGIPAFTAWQAVQLGQITAGTTVLVAGGAGAVACYAIQLAKMRGARVLASVSGPEKGRGALDAGADAIVNYRTESLSEAVHGFTAGRGVEIVIEVDFSTNAPTYPQIVAPHGVIVVYGSSGSESRVPIRQLMRASIQIRPFLIYELTEVDRLAGIGCINALLEKGRLRHSIAATLPIEDVVAAHELGESGSVIGNIVLELG